MSTLISVEDFKYETSLCMLFSFEGLIDAHLGLLYLVFLGSWSLSLCLIENFGIFVDKKQVLAILLCYKLFVLRSIAYWTMFWNHKSLLNATMSSNIFSRILHLHTRRSPELVGRIKKWYWIGNNGNKTRRCEMLGRKGRFSGRGCLWSKNKDRIKILRSWVGSIVEKIETRGRDVGPSRELMDPSSLYSSPPLTLWLLSNETSCPSAS